MARKRISGEMTYSPERTAGLIRFKPGNRANYTGKTTPKRPSAVRRALAKIPYNIEEAEAMVKAKDDAKAKRRKRKPS